jgi:hypothetical protein
LVDYPGHADYFVHPLASANFSTYFLRPAPRDGIFHGGLMDFVRKGLLFAALCALAVLGTGCSDEGSDDTVYNDYTSQTRIALLADTTYVAYDNTDNAAEGSNVDAALQSLGHKTLAFFNIDPDTVSQALQDKDVLVIPELDSDLDGAISDESRSLMGMFVATGGTMVMFGNSADLARTLDFLNNTFNFSLASGSDTVPFTRTNTSGTPFGGGPATLADNNATYGLDVTSLPTDSTAVYTEDNNGDAIVAVIPFAEGRVIYLGWEWYDAAPLWTQDGGWNEILDKAVR